MSKEILQLTTKVGVNHEEQYYIWPAERENPFGLKANH
ncbi:MAG: MbtH family protein [Fischerella sp. CENA71]|nr:MbtH family protein [Fischerella sp. CENA71]